MRGGDIGGQPVSPKSNRKLLPHIYFEKIPSEACQTEELTSSISNEVDNTAGNNSNDIGPQTRALVVSPRQTLQQYSTSYLRLLKSVSKRGGPIRVKSCYIIIGV